MIPNSIRQFCSSLLPVAVIGSLAACGGADTSGLSSEAADPSADPPGSIRVDDVLFVPLTSDWKMPVSTKPIAEQTVDEFAESTRPIRAEVTDEGTKMYRAADPAYDVARAIKANQLMGNVVNNEGARSSRAAANAGNLAAKQDLSPDYFFDVNNAGRPIVADNSGADGQTFPFDAVVYIKGNTGNCTDHGRALHRAEWDAEQRIPVHPRGAGVRRQRDERSLRELSARIRRVLRLDDSSRLGREQLPRRHWRGRVRVVRLGVVRLSWVRKSDDPQLDGDRHQRE